MIVVMVGAMIVVVGATDDPTLGIRLFDAFDLKAVMIMERRFQDKILRLISVLGGGGGHGWIAIDRRVIDGDECRR